MDYHEYEHLKFSLAGNGVLTVTLNRPERLNAANERLHFELSRVWETVGGDDAVRVIVVRGAGGNFSSGGDLDMVERMTFDPALVLRQMHEARSIVFGMIDCPKPIVSAVEGFAIGAGLVVALLADVSIVAEDAKINDGHVRLGVSAGDHAALLWPLLCGVARAKLYLLTGDFMSGSEAAQIGLASKAVTAGDVLSEAERVANRIASRDALAVSWTKRSINDWLRAAAPSFDHSLALEMLSFAQPGARAGVAAIRAKSAGASPDQEAR